MIQPTPDPSTQPAPPEGLQKTAAPQPKRAAGGGTFFQLQLVLSVAFVVATLFTAWTPTGLLSRSLAEKLSMALAPETTPGLPAGILTPTPRARPLIGIVAGHWGNDSGTVCADGYTEAQLNLEVATKVKEDLVGVGVDVDLLKEFDPQLTDYRAVALVSIHTDSCDYYNDLATGFKVAPSISNPRPEKASRLTACLKDRYGTATNLPFHGNTITKDMTSYHAFDEINEETTAVIIEIGFLNNDRRILTEDQDQVVKGIVDGVMCYLLNEDISTPVLP